MTATVTSAVAQAAHDIIDQGYAVVRLSDLDANRLQTAIATANRFFERPLEDKIAHGSTDHNYGYRPFGIEYSVTPERPDMNECFTLWSSRLDLIPEAQDIPELTEAFLSWRDSLAPLVKGILDEVVIMPGSVLTALSGGKIEPLYHQVRNHGLDDRQSIMYFVNPEIDEPLFGWIDAPDGERADIREHVQNAPSQFGLPPVEAL